ncbi:hypothetical protein BSL78_11336 [Apostichopus japonicus]|uniref:Reverse transcriptase domain-containing protein n=1 Tax=Stichopus japonicus TaxID=307972 RepID=A0A2G8KV15_STIJA|nr:hypothetical protein BSL78_11336 [Apostichopus japonicus]
MSLLMYLLDDLLPIITTIINNSLFSGQFPDAYKVARVKPLIKKLSLDCEDMKNYRPISNLRPSVLIARLKERYEITDKALDWFVSYLENREQAVAVETALSDALLMDCGMPQGSVAGPVIFTMYSAPIEDIASSNGIECMTYADDTQLHISMNPSNRDVSVSKLEQCLADIKSWTVRNKLQLNDSKTEVIHVTSRNMKTTPLSGIRVGDTNVEPTSSARILGVILDSQLTMKEHVNNVCRDATNAIRSIGRIRHYLDQDTTEKLVHAYVTSRLDNCNALLYGLPTLKS